MKPLTGSENTKNNSLRRFFLFLAIVCLFAFALPPFSRAQMKNSPAAQEATTAALENFLKAAQKDDFVYRIEGRPDPFFPFLTQEILQAAEAKAEKALAGMQKFEPGQLTLVAIVFGAEPLAMVQDSAGTGYILRKGTKIGRSGQVIDIVSNKVIIEESVLSLTKQKKLRTVEMTLKKEGEK